MDYSRLTHNRQRRGMALIAVLWVVAFLSVLLMATLTLLKVDIEENTSGIQSQRAWELAHQGLSYGIHPKVERDDPLLNFQDPEYDEGFEVSVAPEATRFNMNFIITSGDTNLLLAIFRDWGLEDSEADLLVGAFIDWVDPDDLLTLNGAERDYYQELGFSDRPYNRIFHTLDEMSLVRGFDLLESLRPNWRESFTLRSVGGLDVHEASPEVLSIAAEVDYLGAESFHELVKGEDGIMGTEDDIRFSSLEEALDELGSPAEMREEILKRFRLSGQVLRVESVGWSGNYHYQITAVIGSKSAQTNILDYQENSFKSE